MTGEEILERALELPEAERLRIARALFESAKDTSVPDGLVDEMRSRLEAAHDARKERSTSSTTLESWADVRRAIRRTLSAD